MKKVILAVSLLLFGFPSLINAQDVFNTTSGTISFFSETPLENIDATSNTASAAINIKTKKLFFKVQIKSFVFPRSLMQEHFNENYMESDKFPDATFNGQINEDVDLTKDGVYSVTVTGKLKIHGVETDRNISGIITVKGGQVIVHAEFLVREADHNIEIPTLVMAKIAESISVKVDAACNPYIPKTTK